MSLLREEFACKHCGKVRLDSIFFMMITKARALADTPFVINSGYRCPVHNANVGSTSRNHVDGKAADIRATNDSARGKILKGLYQAGFTRVGVRNDFIHADTMDLPEACWLY